MSKRTKAELEAENEDLKSKAEEAMGALAEALGYDEEDEDEEDDEDLR